MEDWTALRVGLFVAGTVLIGLLLLFWMLLQHLRQQRQLLHAERMKALELGRPMGFGAPNEAEEKQRHNVFWISFWLGGGVPITAVAAAAQAVSQEPLQQLGDVLAIWVSAAVVSVAGVIAATFVMLKARYAVIKERDDVGEKDGSVA